ncbi:NusA N-terminal domain-containing protein [Faecalibacillus intestinalis]|uniref:NusA N-terminal domain-containing protein n=1 Tax=Faecalibacillus intestinalis TaxID=1982626 RepID=UPI0026793FBC
MASNRKFMSALNALCEEKGIEKDVFLEMLKESIAKAYKKKLYGSRSKCTCRN